MNGVICNEFVHGGPHTVFTAYQFSRKAHVAPLTRPLVCLNFPPLGRLEPRVLKASLEQSADTFRLNIINGEY